MLGKELSFSFFETGLFCRTGVSSNTLELSSPNIVFELLISLPLLQRMSLAHLGLSMIKLVQSPLDILQLLQCLCSIRLSCATLFECLLLLFRE